MMAIDGFVMPATQHHALLWLSGSSLLNRQVHLRANISLV